MIKQARLIRLLQKLLSINSENPPGNELKLSQFITREIRKWGIPVKTVCFVKNRPNILATLPGTWPRSLAARQAVLISPHLDTVPIGTGWKYDPYGSQVIHGRIYGRGASDDKGNLACCLEVFKSFVEDGVRLKRDIILAATVDEETGSHAGIIPLLSRKILKPASAVILDADEINAIIAQKGLIHCRVQIFGKKAHGAYNWRGKNAIEMAVRVIEKIKTHKFSYKKHPLLRAPTVNVGTIRGGDKVNIVADFCEFSLDIRYLPGMKHQEILKILRGYLKGTVSKFKIIIDDCQMPYEIGASDGLVKTYLRTAHSLGLKASLKGSEGATVMTFFKKYNIPAFATGYGSAGTAHANNEYACVETLYHGAKLLEKYLKAIDCET